MLLFPIRGDIVKEEYELKLNEDYYVCLSNDLIMCRQKSMNIWANRILDFLVMQLVSQDKDLKQYTTTVKNLADFIGLSASNNSVYEEIKLAIDEILHNVITINQGKSWEKFHWMSLARYEDGTGKLTLELSNEVKPYLIQLKERGFFTQYQIKEMLPMNSIYARWLYQYITMQFNKHRQAVNSIIISIIELRELFECTNKFIRISQFKEKAIEPAIRQINENEQSKYWLEVNYHKTGRSISDVEFIIHDGMYGRKISKMKLGE